jgi:hypothetical protein
MGEPTTKLSTEIEEWGEPALKEWALSNHIQSQGQFGHHSTIEWCPYWFCARVTGRKPEPVGMQQRLKYAKTVY